MSRVFSDLFTAMFIKNDRNVSTHSQHLAFVLCLIISPSAISQTDLEEVHFYVINSLANLASNAETHLQLDETNVPHTLLKWCSNSDDRIRVGATRGLANLCSNRGLHRNMVWQAPGDGITL